MHAIYQRCKMAAISTPEVTSRSFKIIPFLSSYAQLVHFLALRGRCLTTRFLSRTLRHLQPGVLLILSPQNIKGNVQNHFLSGRYTQSKGYLGLKCMRMQLCCISCMLILNQTVWFNIVIVRCLKSKSFNLCILVKRIYPLSPPHTLIIH